MYLPPSPAFSRLLSPSLNDLAIEDAQSLFAPALPMHGVLSLTFSTSADEKPLNRPLETVRWISGPHTHAHTAPLAHC